MRTLVPWRAHELAPWDDLHKLDRRLRQMFGPTWPAANVEAALDWSPAIDLEETDGAYTVTAELPGLKPEEVDVSVENNVLTVRGEKKREETKEEKGKWHVVERSYGSFERSFTLPRRVSEAKVEARFEDGVLNINLPKAEEAASRRIKIDA